MLIGILGEVVYGCMMTGMIGFITTIYWLLRKPFTARVACIHAVFFRWFCH